MTERLRFAEAVCAGHPDRLADSIADRIVRPATSRDEDALVGVEVALHRNVVFVDGRVAAGRDDALVKECDIVALVKEAFVDAGYGTTPSGSFPPDPQELEIRTDLCLGPLGEDERAIRDVSDDQALCIGHAVWGPRAAHRPLEQALASDFVKALESLRTSRPDLRLGPDGKTLVGAGPHPRRCVSLDSPRRGRRLDRPDPRSKKSLPDDRGGVRRGRRTRPARRRSRLARQRRRAFEIGGPSGDNGISGKKLVAQAYGSAVPIGGGATFGKDPRKVDPKGQALARELALKEVTQKGAREATVWLAYRPGDLTPSWVAVVAVPDDDVSDRRAW